MIVAVTGTGTGIGKTHVACALIGALRDRGARVVGWKPVESGVTGDAVTDEHLLREAAGFEEPTLRIEPREIDLDRTELMPGAPSLDDTELTPARRELVLPPTLRLRAALAPNVAARLEGVTIDVATIASVLGYLASRCDVVVLELAGGMFSPLSDKLDNAHFLAAFAPRVLVVAPDRLGVLHDVAATVYAASTVPLALHGIVLSAPEVPDASTGTNAAELGRLRLPVTSIPRAPIAELRTHPAILALARV